MPRFTDLQCPDSLAALTQFDCTNNLLKLRPKRPEGLSTTKY
ncbi:hypothetical protein LRS56_22855 [Pseudomonas poae]|nr:hypothetical protein LRS56_22855 [Pseudomonas poae]